ncbi:MAG: sigma-54-dependent Fis family transcriptional regulator [Nitrospirae bacterium]|nr:sigma-54-dependent Fis family transcriptional regulator [Nitrospirota bacterium]
MKILLVDDDKAWSNSLKDDLEDLGFEVIYEADADKALEQIREHHPDVVLLDILFHGENKGKPTFDTIRKMQNAPPVIILTSTMVDTSYKREDYPGLALDYPKGALKPNDPQTYKIFGDKIKGVVEGAGDIDKYIKKFEEIGIVVGKSEAMRDVCRIILKASGTKATVLITGETGTGKELVARAIHEFSDRSDKPFIAINCAAIPDNLIESELFGHEKGAFTGANNLKRGKFELANTGTIFLDEIGEMPTHLQVKLLRVLQENEVERLGATSTIHIDIRVISATNIDILSAISNGKFRDDLYRRLDVIRIHMPPLRERKKDIDVLTKYFISKLKNELNKPVMQDTIRSDVKDMLENYNWPRNVGELKTAIERAMVMCDTAILMPEHFSFGEIRKNKEVSYDVEKLVDRCMTEKEFGFNDIKKMIPIKSEPMEDILEGICRRCYEEKGGLTQELLIDILKLETRANVQRVLGEHGISTTELKKTYRAKT